MYDNYPPGAANDPNAPYNQVDPEEMEIEVTVSITLSKTVKIAVTDYEYFEGERDEDGCSIPPSYDYSNCNLKEAVEQQVYLPHEAFKHLAVGHRATEDLKGWEVDDFEVILE